jgi:Flp pilus assembly protein TadG
MQTLIDSQTPTPRRVGVIRLIRGRRARHDKRGSAAVEFALIGPVFLALIFAILETALVFFANQYLETAVNDASRLIRTGQAHKNGFSSTQFKNEICGRLVAFFSDCQTKLKLDVRTSATFTGADTNKPVDGSGNYNGPQAYDHGTATQIVVVRAYYEWPLIATGFGLDLADIAGTNKRMLAAVTAFRNEPFPW